VEIGGVRILGHANLPGRVARTSSQMYSSNLGSFVEHFWDKETKALRINPADPLLSACLITHGGAVIHETIRKELEAKS
jgi:NAD(P) transhydrogenase subunit alpha